MTTLYMRNKQTFRSPYNSSFHNCERKNWSISDDDLQNQESNKKHLPLLGQQFTRKLYQESYLTLQTLQAILNQFHDLHDTVSMKNKSINDLEKVMSYKDYLTTIKEIIKGKQYKKENANIKMIEVKNEKMLKRILKKKQMHIKIHFKLNQFLGNECYNYNYANQKIQQKKDCQENQISYIDTYASGCIQFDQPIYSLAYLVYVCLEKLQEFDFQEIKKRYAEIRQLSQKFVEKIFQKQKSDDEQPQIQETQKAQELKAQTKDLLISFTQILCQKILKIKKKETSLRKRIAHNFLQYFLEHFYLWNYVINSYEVTHRRNINFKQYISQINDRNIRDQIINESSSFYQIKLNIFWQTFKSTQKSYFLKRIFIECFNKKSEQRIRLLGENNLDFSILYQNIFPIESQLKMIDLQIKYMVHFYQYCHQIIAELSEAKNISLDVVFNAIRFLLINLVLHFANICTDQILNLAQKQCGRLHRKLLEKMRNENDKWKDCIEKSQRAIKLSFDKTLKYMEIITNPNELTKSANAQKVKKFLEQQKQLMGLFFALNIDEVSSTKEILNLEQKNLKKIKQVFNLVESKNNLLPNYIKKYYIGFRQLKNVQSYKGQRDQEIIPQRHSVLFQQILQQVGKEYLSVKITQKTWKKLLKKHLGEQAVKTYTFGRYSNNLSAIYSQQNNKTKNRLQLNQNFDNFQRQWVISIIENIKLYSLFTTLPFYSFQTQRQNERIRHGRLINPDLRRRQPKKLDQIMKTLDIFYIYKAERLNTFYLQKCSNDQLLQIKNKYIRYTRVISQFFSQQNQNYRFNKKLADFPLKQLTRYESVEIQSIKYQNDIKPKLILNNEQKVDFPLLELDDSFQSYQQQLQNMNDTTMNDFLNKFSYKKQGSTVQSIGSMSFTKQKMSNFSNQSTRDSTLITLQDKRQVSKNSLLLFPYYKSQKLFYKVKKKIFQQIQTIARISILDKFYQTEFKQGISKNFHSIQQVLSVEGS